MMAPILGLFHQPWETWVQPGPALAVVDIWKVNLLMGEFSLSLSLYLFVHFKACI